MVHKCKRPNHSKLHSSIWIHIFPYLEQGPFIWGEFMCHIKHSYAARVYVCICVCVCECVCVYIHMYVCDLIVFLHHGVLGTSVPKVFNSIKSYTNRLELQG